MLPLLWKVAPTDYLLLAVLVAAALQLSGVDVIGMASTEILSLLGLDAWTLW